MPGLPERPRRRRKKETMSTKGEVIPSINEIMENIDPLIDPEKGDREEILSWYRNFFSKIADQIVSADIIAAMLIDATDQGKSCYANWVDTDFLQAALGSLGSKVDKAVRKQLQQIKPGRRD